MAQRIRKPTVEELPPSARREFVDEMFVYWAAARRPTVRAVAEAVAKGDYEGTTSREQFRRMLTGATMPRTWTNVEAVFLALCAMAGIDPDGHRWPDENYYDVYPRRQRLLELWDAAMDEPDPQPRPAGARTASSYDDEPPF